MSEDFSYEHLNLDGQESVKNTVRQSEHNEGRLSKLELDVKNLSIINEALYEILVSKLNITAAELTVIMEQVVVSRLKRKEAKSTCRSCNRLVPSNRQKCMYCGGEFLNNVNLSPFD